MTFREDYTVPGEIVEQIAIEGFDALPELIRMVLNVAMEMERERHLAASRYERSPRRRGHANGYKAKTVRTRLGEITCAVPQVREGRFYPQALEKGNTE